MKITKRHRVGTAAAAVVVAGASLGLGLSTRAFASGSSSAAMVWTSASGKQAPASVAAALPAIHQAVAGAEDAYEAIFAPPPTGVMAKTALEDNPAVTPAATLDRTGRHALLTSADADLIESRGLAALSQVYTPAMASHIGQILTGVVGTVSSGQDLLGGGGASVVTYKTESINGSTAQVTASVAQWSRIGYVDATTGAQHWQINRAIVIVTDTLARNASGQWQVAGRSWTYAPGQGP